MEFADLRPLQDQGSLYASLSQLLLADHLAERLGEHNFEVDMQTSRLSFVATGGGSSSDRIDTTAELLASIAPGPRSMLWGWAHPQATGGVAGELRAHGQQHGIDSLISPEVPLPTDASGDLLANEIAQAAHVVGQVTAAVTGRTPYYSAPAGGGTRVVFLLSGYDFPGLRLDHTVPMRVTQLLQGGSVNDHRNAVHGLATGAAWQIAWDPDWTLADITDPQTGNTLTATFDEHGRLQKFSMRLSARDHSGGSPPPPQR